MGRPHVSMFHLVSPRARSVGQAVVATVFRPRNRELLVCPGAGFLDIHGVGSCDDSANIPAEQSGNDEGSGDLRHVADNAEREQ